ncbi:MAG: hypothetical protein IT381_26685 [Deltaproteobacteria bacterium]|nr:hypothetical protein [Deltaproteobacteria bacterium]
MARADVLAQRTGGLGGYLAGILILVPLSALALIMGEGEFAVALSPLIIAILGFAVIRLPLRVTITALVFVCIVVDNPMEKPANGLWQSPLYPIGKLIFVNLSKLSGIGALGFCLLDAAIVLFLLLSWFRKTTRDPSEKGAIAPIKPLTQLLVASFLMVCFLEAYGISRGGNFKNSLWQIRSLLMMPLVCYLFIRAFRHPDDLKPLGTVLIVGSCIKALIGFYYFWVICRPLHMKPQYVTSHADTMLYATSIGLLISYWLETRSRRSILAALVAIPIIMIGIITNDRRLVFVSIFGGCFTMFMMLDWKIRRRFIRYGLLASPLLAVYFVAGMNSKSMAFMPVQRIMSVATQEDRSSGTRDIENFNLIWTLKPRPLMGQGFGHEYNEIVQADSIASLFALYRYIGHNSVLWLWSVSGFVGFTVIWMYLAVGVYLLVRSYRFAKDPTHRVMAMTCIFAIIAFELQAWGDMGIENWSGVFLVAASIAAASRLAVATGAWGRAPAAAVEAPKLVLVGSKA